MNIFIAKCIVAMIKKTKTKGQTQSLITVMLSLGFSRKTFKVGEYKLEYWASVYKEDTKFNSPDTSHK